MKTDKRIFITAALTLALTASSIVPVFASDTFYDDGAAAIHMILGTEQIYGEAATRYESFPLDVSDYMVEYFDFSHHVDTGIVPVYETFRFDSATSGADPGNLTLDFWSMHQGTNGWYADWFRIFDSYYPYPPLQPEHHLSLPFEYDKDYILNFSGNNSEHVLVTVTGNDGSCIYWFSHLSSDWTPPASTPNDSTGSWVSDRYGWKFQRADGSYITNTWIQSPSDNLWYYIGPDRYMITNAWIDGTWYVGEDGHMLTNTVTPDGYRVGPDGAWIP